MLVKVHQLTNIQSKYLKENMCTFLSIVKSINHIILHSLYR